MNAVNERAHGDRSPFLRLRVGAIVAVAVAVALILWLVLKDDDNGNDNGSAAAKPTAATVSDLQAVPDSVGHPVFWAGARTGYTYELTSIPRGVYVRYLPSGVPLGDNQPNYLTVATYPFRNGYAATRKTARKQGAISRKLPGGGIAVTNTAQPKSVYVAYRGTDVQVEVFDPSPARARRLAFSGRIVPVR